MTTLTEDFALMCAVELQDTIEFMFRQLESALDKKERREILLELRAAIDHYNRVYGKTFVQPK